MVTSLILVGAIETGRGDAPPLPASRLPRWRYSHGSLNGKISEKDDFPASSRDTASHRVSPRTAPAPLGAGEEAEGRARWGLSEETYMVKTGHAPSPSAAPGRNQK